MKRIDAKMKRLNWRTVLGLGAFGLMTALAACGGKAIMDAPGQGSGGSGSGGSDAGPSCETPAQPNWPLDIACVTNIDSTCSRTCTDADGSKYGVTCNASALTCSCLYDSIPICNCTVPADPCVFEPGSLPVADCCPAAWHPPL